MASRAGAEMTTDLREHRRRRGLPDGRTLHLLDLENLAGGSAATSDDVDAAVSAYEAVVRFAPGDHRVVACGKGLVYPVKDRWAGALVKYARGIDGADRLLLTEAEPEYVAAHYDRVVVASGDHVFSGLVAELDRRGVDVCVVSRRSSLARRLSVVAPVVWYLELDGAAAPARVA